jgi:hypothetical protein
MSNTPTDEQLRALDSLIQEAAQDDGRWERFKDRPENYLAEQGVELPLGVALRFLAAPASYEVSAAAELVRCPPGYDAELTYQWDCVPSDCVERKRIVPTGGKIVTPFGTFPDFKEETYIECRSHELRRIPVWTCVRSVKMICGGNNPFEGLLNPD